MPNVVRGALTSGTPLTASRWKNAKKVGKGAETGPMPRVGEALKMLVFAPLVSGMGVHASSIGSDHYSEAFMPKYGDLAAQFQAARN